MINLSYLSLMYTSLLTHRDSLCEWSINLVVDQDSKLLEEADSIDRRPKCSQVSVRMRIGLNAFKNGSAC